MSLAATLSADGMRPASFLPAIKCSNCGEEIEIARMGDHVCSSRNQTHVYAASSLSPAQTQYAPPTPAPLSNPYTMPSWSAGNQHHQPESQSAYSPLNTRMPATSFAPSPLAQTYSSPQDPRPYASTLQPATPVSLRATKLPLPPRINPDAGHNPFLAPSFPRSASPASPVLSVRSGRSGSSNGSRPPALRNMVNVASPRTLPRSPSPELASNLDCAFPSFPASSSNSGSRPGTSSGRKTPNSDRAPSRAASRAGVRAERDAHGEGSRGPSAGDSAMRRANTLGSRPQNTEYWQADRDEQTEAMPSLPKSFEDLSLQRLPSNVSDDQSPRRPALRSSRTESPPAPPPPADFFEYRRRSNGMTPRPSQDAEVPAPLRIGNRSKTFPVDDKQHQAATSTPPPVPNDYVERGRQRRPSTASSVRSDQANPHISNLPVRSSSRSRTRVAPRFDEAPPVPKPVQHYRHLSKHAPSESASSASSTSRSYSNTNSSEGPSPVGSAASSIDVLSPISQANMYDREERPRSERMKSAGYSTKREQLNPGLRAEQPVQRSPTLNFARPRPTNGNGSMQPTNTLADAPYENASMRRPSDRQYDNTGLAPHHDMPPPLRTNLPPNNMEKVSQTPKSPDEPWAPAWGATSPPKKDDYDPYRARSPNPAARGRAVSNASSIYQPERVPSMPAPPMPLNAPHVQSLQRRNTSARPQCRGCKQIIEGKSVKAADGNLTGRWHKHCFNCQTCRQPFATADFYVINDLPYCKQHYHEKNGSLCAGCTRGIEGQYLETSARGPEMKYHPHCFTCHECRLILSNDYFEINGQPYCERHALAAMRGQGRFGAGGGGGYNNRGGYGTPSGLHPGRRELMAERRTTRLMMM